MRRAIDSVLAQSMRVDEIIVVDDGSTDGTADMLNEAFGERIRCIRQENAGVSAARNRGMSMAAGRFFALLDSDDEWAPDKIESQWRWMQAHPDFGMVLCDVERVTDSGEQIDVMRRRDAIPEDGFVLRHVLCEPSLIPASVFMRREVYADVGGFDERLHTAEDLDYHLRIAKRWKIGIVEKTLVRARRGHQGLSTLNRTYDDYLQVLEAAIADAESELSPSDLARAWYNVSIRSARGRIFQRKWHQAIVQARRAWANATDASQRRRVLSLIPLAGRHRLASLIKGSR